MRAHEDSTVIISDLEDEIEKLRGIIEMVHHAGFCSGWYGAGKFDPAYNEAWAEVVEEHKIEVDE